jgi:hypothetical protein
VVEKAAKAAVHVENFIFVLSGGKKRSSNGRTRMRKRV